MMAKAHAAGWDSITVSDEAAVCAHFDRLFDRDAQTTTGGPKDKATGWFCEGYQQMVKRVMYWKLVVENDRAQLLLREEAERALAMELTQSNSQPPSAASAPTWSVV
jgi:hypothetical protein